MDMYRILENFDAVNSKKTLTEGSMKRHLEDKAEHMDKADFVAHAAEYGMSAKEAAAFWVAVNGEDEEVNEERRSEEELNEGLSPKIKKIINAYRNQFEKIYWDKDRKKIMMSGDKAFKKTCQQLGIDPDVMMDYLDQEYRYLHTPKSSEKYTSANYGDPDAPVATPATPAVVLTPKIKKIIKAYRKLYPTIAYDKNGEDIMEPEEAHDETSRRLGVDPSDMDDYLELFDEEVNEERRSEEDWDAQALAQHKAKLAREKNRRQIQQPEKTETNEAVAPAFKPGDRVMYLNTFATVVSCDGDSCGIKVDGKPGTMMVPASQIKKPSYDESVAEGDMEEGNLFTGNLAKARAAGKKQADLDGDGDMEKVQEVFPGTPEYELRFGKPDAASAFDKKKISTGTVYSRRYQDEPETDDDAPKKAGRPKGKDKGPERVTKGAWKHKDGRKVKEDHNIDIRDQGEYDREGDMAQQQLHTVVDAARELHAILASDENLPEWVQAKITKALDYIDTARDYVKSSHAERGEGVNEIAPVIGAIAGRALAGAAGAGSVGQALGGLAGRAVAGAMGDDAVDEAGYSAKAARAGKDIGKPGKAFAKIAKSAGERYGSKERGEKVAGAVLAKLRAKEGVEEEVHVPTTRQVKDYHKVLDKEISASQARKKADADIGSTKKVRAALKSYDDYGMAGAKYDRKYNKESEINEYLITKDKKTDKKEPVLNLPKNAEKSGIKSQSSKDDQPMSSAASISRKRNYMEEPVEEKAPPGAKAERMVKHIKSGYAKDGKLTDREKAIAYATAWKAKKAGKVEEESTETKDQHAEKAGKKVTKDLEYDMKHKGKDDAKAEKAGKKVTKDIEYDDKKDKKKEVEETTVAGSVATAPGAAPKAKGGIQFGKGVYEGQVAESFEKKLNNILNEGMSVNVSTDDTGKKSISVNATDTDAEALGDLLKMAGLFSSEGYSRACPHCGGVHEAGACGADMVEEGDLANSPDEVYADKDYMTQTLSGGLNGPKTTGQTTGPIVNRQDSRQGVMAEAERVKEAAESRLWSLYKEINK